MKEFLPRHILIFEPRIEGHNLIWLRYVTEDLLSAGFRLTLAVDCRPGPYASIQNQLSALIPNVKFISIFTRAGKLRGGSKIRALAQCFRESHAQEVFINNLDEIASHSLRCAAFGVYPSNNLQGRLSGIYFRPGFLVNPVWPLGNLIKSIGFRRLCQRMFFKNICLLDEYLFDAIENGYYHTQFHLLPDPWHGDFSLLQTEARRKLKIPGDKFVFLNYGIGDRRKGLHLVIRSMLASLSESRFFLLCAGQIAKDREIANGLDNLKRRGLAKVMDRFVSDYEEKLCFCASDAVLLPYINHFGSSGVLSRATAAGKMVIASDEGLLGKRVREHRLGLLFPSGNVKKLRECMKKASLLTRDALAEFRFAGIGYARSCSRDAFRRALLLPYDVEMSSPSTF